MKQSFQTIHKQYGSKMARRLWDATMDGIDLIGELVADENIMCHFLRKGHITLAVKPSHFEKMQKKVTWYKRVLNHDLHVLSQDALPKEIGSSAFYGGLVDEWSASLDPAKYLFGLAQVVARCGGLLCEGTAVTRIDRPSKKFHVHTSQGILKANEVLIATNGYTDALMPQLKARILPVGNYAIVTEPLSPSLQRRISPNGRTFTDSKWFANYFRLTPDGRLLFGGRNTLSTNLNLIDSGQHLYLQMIQIFPALRNIAITHSWSGLEGLTVDQMPHMGRINGVHYALGYGGHGVALATYLGSEVGKLICGRISRSPFMEIEHPTRLLYRAGRWIRPFTGWWYRFKDWIS